MRSIIAYRLDMTLARRPRRRRHLWWWFLVPLLSAGFATFAIIGYAGRRLHQRRVVRAAGWYLLLELTLMAVAFTPAALPTAIAFMATCWLGGTLHSLALSGRFSAQLRRQNRPEDPDWPAHDAAQHDRAVGSRWPDPAIEQAYARFQRRHDARRIVADNLPLAAELRIGRPDLDRRYDDGGLVDVNQVPADVLVAYLDMAPEIAREVVRTRAIRNGFTSADDMLISVDCLNPARLEMIRDRMIFIPSDLISTLPMYPAEHPLPGTSAPVATLADRGREDLGGHASPAA